jgi:hypothetical protein
MQQKPQPFGCGFCFCTGMNEAWTKVRERVDKSRIRPAAPDELANLSELPNSKGAGGKFGGPL